MSHYPAVAGSQQVVPYGSPGQMVPVSNRQSPNRQGPVIDMKTGKVRKPDGMIGKGLGVGFAAFDAYSRIRDGESAPVAIGKAVLTNALFMTMGPVAGTAAALGVAAVGMAPEISRAMDAVKSNHGSKATMFGGGFAETEGQTYLKQMGMANISSARQGAAAMMSNHARGAFKTY